MLVWSLRRLPKCLQYIVNRQIASTSKQSNAIRKGSKRFSNRKAPIEMERIWVPAYNTLKGCTDTTLPQYKLLSYNILAQDLLVDNIFLYYDIDQRFLRWQNRMDLLGQEIYRLQPDILCLQEVQQSHLKEIVRQFSSRDVGQLKLEYVFKKRTGSRCDGCAIIYDRNKFKLVAERCVEYYTDDCATSNRENIALMTKFILRDKPSITFVAATTHLLYNPRRHDVRIYQVKKLMTAIIEFSKLDDNDSIRCPVMLTGDFNCTTDSTAFRLLTERMTVAQGVQGTEGRFQMEPIDFGTDCASTFQDQWITVDYILKSCSQKGEKGIQINSTYNLPNLNTCRAHGKLPNKFNGSDHFSLAVQFSIV